MSRISSMITSNWPTSITLSLLRLIIAITSIWAPAMQMTRAPWPFLVLPLTTSTDPCPTPAILSWTSTALAALLALASPSPTSISPRPPRHPRTIVSTWLALAPFHTALSKSAWHLLGHCSFYHINTTLSPDIPSHSFKTIASLQWHHIKVILLLKAENDLIIVCLITFYGRGGCLCHFGVLWLFFWFAIKSTSKDWPSNSLHFSCHWFVRLY